MRKNTTYSSRGSYRARHAHALGAKEFKTYDTSLIRPKRSKAPTIFGIVLGVIMLIGLVAVLLFAAKGCTQTPELTDPNTPVSVIVSQGSSTSDVAKTLYEAHLIASTKDFINTVKAAGADGSLKPGNYELTSGMSADEMVAALLAGPVQNSVTIPEGSTAAQVASLINEATSGRISSDAVMVEINNASAYANTYPFVKDAYNNSLEGYLFPKTYPISDTDNASSLINAMLKQFADETSSLDLTYANAQGLDLSQVVTLASIVEKEAASDNKATVASVFYNRLAQGMPLQSDATIAYVVQHDPTPDDLQVDSPYNTYTNNGLTPGPICSPGLDTLEAVCAPEQTSYLYFYFAKDDTGALIYHFSDTYDEHQDAINAG